MALHLSHLRARKSIHFTLERLEAREMLTATGLYRSIDGTGNNAAHPDWGSTDEQLLRKAPAAYADGVSSPAGANPRRWRAERRRWRARTRRDSTVPTGQPTSPAASAYDFPSR